MPEEFRTIVITEVDPATRTVKGRDEHGQPLAVTNKFLQPLITVPQNGEKWLVHRQGGQWLLDRRWDGEDKLLDLEAGDVHIDAKNNLIITAAQKIMINGEEISNDVKVVIDNPTPSGITDQGVEGDAGGPVTSDAVPFTTFSAPAIRFKSSEDIEYTAIINEADNTIDI